MTYYCFVLPLRKDSDGSWWQTDCDDIKFHNATTWPTLSPTPNPPPPPTDHPNQLTASLLPTGDRSPQLMVNEIMFRTCILLKVYTIHVLLSTQCNRGGGSACSMPLAAGLLIVGRGVWGPREHSGRSRKYPAPARGWGKAKNIYL